MALLGTAAALAPALRSPGERVEARVAQALDDAGVRLADPLELESSGGDAPVWTARLRVREDDGSVASVRLAVRPDPPEAPEGADAGGPDGAIPAQWLFPGVDCDSPYPLTWLGDSDSSYRTTRQELAECLSRQRGGDVLVTIAWRSAAFDTGDPGSATDAVQAAATEGDGTDGTASTDGTDSSGGAGGAPVGRQTWRVDARGGVVWLHNGGSSSTGSASGLTARQQRVVATAQGLLDAP